MNDIDNLQESLIDLKKLMNTELDELRKEIATLNELVVPKEVKDIINGS